MLVKLSKAYTIFPDVDVEHLFSKGCIILPYLCNCLLSQSTHTLMCLGQWCKLGLVKDDDIRKATCDEVEGNRITLLK